MARVHQVIEAQPAAAVDLGRAGARGGEEQAGRALGAADVSSRAGERRDEAAEHVVHHGEDEGVAIGEVDVERSAGQVGAGADRVQAGIEAVEGELLHARGDQRRAGRQLGLGARPWGCARGSAGARHLD